MKPRGRKFVIEVDSSTYRWLRALARANSRTDIHPDDVTAEELLAQAAFCMADAAGRRTGSWEASVAQSMLDSSGYQRGVEWPATEHLRKWDEQANERHRQWWDSLTPAQKADHYGMTGDKRAEFIAYCESHGPETETVKG